MNDFVEGYVVKVNAEVRDRLVRDLVAAHLVKIIIVHFKDSVIGYGLSVNDRKREVKERGVVVDLVGEVFDGSMLFEASTLAARDHTVSLPFISKVVETDISN